ncbi:MAG: DUF302 domain-containing protein [Gemmatimonadota bacterium]
MRDADYLFRKDLPDTPFEQAVERVTEALGAEGFGVLTSIDVRETLRRKLEVDFKPYTILGACNPNLAHEALETDDNIGLLLPCNVVVAGREEGSEVAIARPTSLLAIAHRPEVAPIAALAETKLRRVYESL